MNTDLQDAAQQVLTDHQRHRGGCLCGWGPLGESHPRHQVAMLHEAGLLRNDTRED